MHNRLISINSSLNYAPEYSLTDNFRKWFGKSVVVNENHEPLICYHKSRSNQPFTEFRHETTEDGNPVPKLFENCYGFYFVHSLYRDQVQHFDNAFLNGIDYLVFLHIENPLYVEDKPNKMLVINKRFHDMHIEGKHDGIIIKRSASFDEFVVFHSHQIKHINNNGNFSDSLNIYE